MRTFIVRRPPSIHAAPDERSWSDRAIPRNGYLWDATSYFGHIAVSVGLPGDRFARISAPFKGDSNRAALFADFLAQKAPL